jgi:hypothetical protein
MALVAAAIGDGPCAEEALAESLGTAEPCMDAEQAQAQHSDSSNETLPEFAGLLFCCVDLGEERERCSSRRARAGSGNHGLEL